MSRPVLEGDIANNLEASPDILAVWGKLGWQAFQQRWGKLETGNKMDFIYDTFDHNKGYGRAYEMIQKWRSGTLENYLKNYLRGKRFEPLRVGSRAWYELWTGIMGEVVTFSGTQSASAGTWRRYLRESFDGFAAALGTVGVTRTQATEFVDRYVQFILYKMFAYVEDEEISDDDLPTDQVDSGFVTFPPLPAVRPFPVPAAWQPGGHLLLSSNLQEARRAFDQLVEREGGQGALVDGALRSIPQRLRLELLRDYRDVRLAFPNASARKAAIDQIQEIEAAIRRGPRGT
jgi:hypothetical protein